MVIPLKSVIQKFDRKSKFAEKFQKIAAEKKAAQQVNLATLMMIYSGITGKCQLKENPVLTILYYLRTQWTRLLCMKWERP